MVGWEIGSSTDICICCGSGTSVRTGMPTSKWKENYIFRNKEQFMEHNQTLKVITIILSKL